jgi:hypothetical protein
MRRAYDVQTRWVAREDYYRQGDLDSWLVELTRHLSAGEPAAIEEALAFLERDPYFFRSGYARERVARRLSHVELSAAQKARARAIVLSRVDGRRFCPHPGIGRLARAVADNPLRRELRARLHHRDPAVARRALRMVVNVRRPGLTSDDIAAAQALVLGEAARGQWLSPTVERLALYVWSREWEDELRSVLSHHDPDRAAAKRLIGAVDRRRPQRPDP